MHGKLRRNSAKPSIPSSFRSARKFARLWLRGCHIIRDEKLWGNDDPLFPATLVTLGAARQIEVTGMAKGQWSNASPIRSIFCEAFVSAGLPYFNPHSFRNTLVQLGQDVCMTPEQFKASSQNLGHEKVLTTFLSFGEVACQRQGEIIRDLAMPQRSISPDADIIAEAVYRKLHSSETDFKKKAGQ